MFHYISIEGLHTHKITRGLKETSDWLMGYDDKQANQREKTKIKNKDFVH